MLTKFRNMLVPTKKKKRAFWEGGKLTKNNNFNPLAINEFEYLARVDRIVLRNRARWLKENNAIMSNIDKTIVNNVIGNGITLQSKTGMNRVDNEIEELFKKWMKNCDVTGRVNFKDLQRIILENRMVDGEIFIYKKITNDSKHPFKLQLLESSRLNEGEGINGVEIGSEGEVKGYYFISAKNPYEASFDTIFIDSKNIIHYFKLENPSQYRGMSEYKQAIMDLKNFMSFNSSLIEAVRARANIAYVIKSDANIKDFMTTEEYEDIQTINGLSVFYLNKGEDITKLDPDIVSGEYKPFVESVIRLIASARNISYELAYRDFSKVNFSSARASIIQDNKRFDHEQQHLIDYVLTPIFNEWLEVNVLAGNLKTIKPSVYLNNKDKFQKAVWIRPAREWVDPLKDIKAIESELNLGITTLSDVVASKGKDLEEILIQRKKEKELFEKYGIETSTTNKDNKKQ